MDKNKEIQAELNEDNLIKLNHKRIGVLKKLFQKVIDGTVTVVSHAPGAKFFVPKILDKINEREMQTVEPEKALDPQIPNVTLTPEPVKTVEPVTIVEEPKKVVEPTVAPTIFGSPAPVEMEPVAVTAVPESTQEPEVEKKTIKTIFPKKIFASNQSTEVIPTVEPKVKKDESIVVPTSTPIDLDKWNAAEWRGMLYLFYPGAVPVLGLLYRNYAAAKSIFTDWKKTAKDNFADDFIKVDYVTPPFPQDCWVYTDKERSFGKGYFVHIGPNTEESINRAVSSGVQPEELLLASFSRYQWMDELNGSKNRDLFQYLTREGSGYLLMPIGIKDAKKPIEESNLIIDFNYAIRMKKVTFKTGLEVEDNDLCKVVLQKAEEK